MPAFGGIYKEKIMGTNIKILILISAVGAAFGYFVLSPFAMYIAHITRLDAPIYEMALVEVFTSRLLLWSAPFTVFGLAIGLGAGILYQRVRDRTEAIKKEREYTRLLVDNMAEGMLTVDRDYKIVSANRAFLEISGHPLDEVIGKYCYEISHGIEKPCDSSGHQCPFKTVMETGKPITTEHVHLDKDGNEMYLEIKASPLKDEGGNIVHMIELLRDITMRKRADELIRESETRYRNLAENALVGIYKTNLEGKILYANKALSDMFGYGSPGELTSKSVIPLYKDPKDRDILLRELEKKGKVGNYELELVTETGEPRNVLLSTTLERNTISGMVMDTTGRKQAEEALRESEERFRSLVESSENIIVMQDLDGRYLYYNAPSFYGVAPEDVVGKTPYDLHKPEKAAEIIERINNVVETGEGMSGDEESSLEGMDLWLHYQMSPIKDAKGRVTAVTTVLQNITELKWAEQSLKKYIEDLEGASKMKDLATDIITHDLLGPAGAIRNSVDLLLDDADGEQIELLKVIEWGANKQMEIIELTNRLSKLESVKEMKKTPTDLRDIIEQAVEDIRLIFEDADLVIENNVTKQVMANANPIIKEVFLNLFSNAARYAATGKKVIIEAAEYDKDSTVTVKDFGPGILDETKESIFERFTRRKKESVKGTGLGLAIAKRVVDLHGGRIWVEDNPEGGAVFKVSLPKS